MDLLFSKTGLSSWMHVAGRELLKEIESQDPDYVLNVSQAELTTFFVAKWELDVPVLDHDGIYINKEGDVQIDVSGDYLRSFNFGSGQPEYRQGTRIEIAVPFTGDPDLFYFQPSRGTYSPPRAKVGKGRLLLIYEGLDQSAAEITTRYRTEVSTIDQWLGWIREDAESYNANLAGNIEALIQARREKVLANRSMVASIGLPIKERVDQAKTYTVPGVQRKASITKPTATQEPYVPEPALDDAEYDAILGIITNMTHVIERSPSAFETMGEEDLRQHFLVQLNGQYEGDATGETFNFDGKTDILIRRGDRNVFIAECKFWDGPSTVSATVDQILGYLSWRDTKTAVLLFVRNKNFTAVVDQIVPLVEAHPSHKTTLDSRSETEFRFVFGQAEDPNRELKLAVLLFAVPSSG